MKTLNSLLSLCQRARKQKRRERVMLGLLSKRKTGERIIGMKVHLDHLDYLSPAWGNGNHPLSPISPG
jgi:hypothetical protein